MRRTSWIRISPSYGLLYSVILFLLVPACVVIYGYAWNSVRFGLLVRLLAEDSLRRQNELYAETIFLTVDAKERWALNGKSVLPGEMPTILRALSRGRSNCAVFLDVDKDLPYYVAIQAIDSVQGTGFEVILLTPGTKRMRIP